MKQKITGKIKKPMWTCPCPNCGLWFGSLEALQEHLGKRKGQKEAGKK
jgi:hypothetical protein